MTIESPHGLLAQIEPQVDRGGEIPGAQGTFQVAERLVVAGLARGGFVVIVEPVDGLDLRSLLILLAEGVVEVDIQDLGKAPPLSLGHQPLDLMAAQRGPHLLSAPGTDPKEIRPVGGVGRIEKLALQRGQGLGFVADQQAVCQIEEMVSLRSGQRETQHIEQVFQGRRRLYNAGQHGDLR
jgi:hypothetical protein